jgi:hypothetical protein
MKALGLPLWAGGVQDQPHIWLEEIGIIENTIKLFDAMNRASQQSAQVPGEQHDSSNDRSF